MTQLHWCHNRKLQLAGLIVLVGIFQVERARANDDPVADPAKASVTSPNWWLEDIWNAEERGFNWYPPEKKRTTKKKEAQQAPKEQSKALPAKTFENIKDLEEMKKEFARIKEVAIFDPTREHVTAYLRAQKVIFDRSTMFADVARRTVWQTPDLDYGNKAPQPSFAINNHRVRQNQRQVQAMQDLSQQYGLVFFFKSDCPFCHDMAPLMAQFEATYGMPVISIGLDGVPIEGVPNFRADNGISRFVTHGEGVQTVPAIYLVKNDSKEVMLLGTGAMAMDTVAMRARVLMTTKPGEIN